MRFGNSSICVKTLLVCMQAQLSGGSRSVRYGLGLKNVPSV